MEPLEVLRQALRSADGVGFATAVYRYVAAADALTHLTAGCEMAERKQSTANGTALSMCWT